MKNTIKKNGIYLSTVVFALSLVACSNYVQEFEDDYHDIAYTDPIVLPPESSSSGGIISSSDASNFIASSDDSGVIAGSSAATLPVVVLANCDNFEGEVWYSEDKKDGNLFEKTDSINFQYYFKRSDVKHPVQLYASNAFCIEYESFAAYENIEFYIGNEYKNSLRDTLDRNSPARAFNLDVALDNCVHWKDSSEATACTESNLGNAANNVNYFVSRNARITKVKAIGFTIAESSSNSSSSNELKNCDAYNSGKALYMDNAISSSLFKKFTKNDSTWFVMNGDSVVQLNSSSMFCIEYSSTSDDSKYFYYGSNGKDSSAYFKKYLNADSALAFSLSSVNVSGCIRVNKGKTYYNCNSYTGRYALDNMNFFGGANGLSIKKVYLLNADVIPDPSKNVSSSSSAKSSSSADNPKSSSSSSSDPDEEPDVDIFSAEYSVESAASYFKKISNGWAISGILLFDANDEKMKNGEEINTRSSTGDLDPSFADGWMKVSGYSRPDAPQVAFFADPGLETEAPDLPVDIRSWGGVCVTYSSNVDFMLVARYNWDGKIKNVEIGKIERTTSAYPVTQKCLEWGEKKDSLTAIDEISLIHIQEEDGPEIATIYIKNISTVKKNEVVINVEGTAGVYGDLLYKLEDETIDLTLFGSFTVPKDVRGNNIYLMVTADGKDYYSKTAFNSGVALLDEVCGPVEDASPCETYGQDFSTLQNPVLNSIGLQNLGQFDKGDEIKYTVTFNLKSWYAETGKAAKTKTSSK